MSLLNKLEELKKLEPSKDLINILEEFTLLAKKKRDLECYFNSKLYLSELFFIFKNYNKSLMHAKNVFYSSESENFDDCKLRGINSAIRALKYLNFMIELFECIKYKQSYLKTKQIEDVSVDIDLAFVYMKLNKYDSALIIYQNLLNKDLTNKNISKVKSQIAQLYIKQKKYDEAKKEILESKVEAKLINDQYGVFHNQYLLAVIEYENKNYKVCKKILEETLIGLNKIDYTSISKPLLLLVRVLLKLNLHKECSYFIDNYVNLIDNEKNHNIRRQFYEISIKVFANNPDKKLFFTNKLLNLADKMFDYINDLSLVGIEKIEESESTKENQKNMVDLIENINQTINYIGKIDNNTNFRDIFMGLNKFMRKFVNFEESTLVKYNKYDDTFDLFHFKKDRVYDRKRSSNDLENTIFEEVIKNKKTKIITSSLYNFNLKDAFTNKYIDNSDINSMVSFPMIVEDNEIGQKLLGGITFLGKGENFILSEDNLSLLNIAMHIFKTKVMNLEFSIEVDNHRQVFELALDNSETGIMYSSDLYNFEISKYLRNLLSFNKNISYDDIIDIFDTSSRALFNDIIDKIKDYDFTIINPKLDVLTKAGIWLKLHFTINVKEDRFIFLAIKVNDITLEREKISEVSNLAYYDNLTGIFNRNKMLGTLDEYLMNNFKFSVLMMDLNKFKFINDTYGHDVGDDVLKFVGNSLVNVFGKQGFLPFRQSGDEFFVFMKECVDKRVIDKMIIKYNKVLKENFSINLMTKLPLSGSIGVVRYPTDTTNSSKILKYADIAMYKAKKERDDNNNWHYFEKKDLIDAQTINIGETISLFDKVEGE